MSEAYVCMMQGCDNPPAPGLNICKSCNDEQQAELRKLFEQRPKESDPEPTP